MSAVAVRSFDAADGAGVLGINAQHAPHVATLDAVELERLRDLGASVLVAAESRELVGYLIAFGSAAPYDGEEFLRLRKILQGDFVYVDQLAVAAACRGRGIGRLLYEAIAVAAPAGEAEWLCCEVNEHPPNPGSLSFHQRLGFARIGGLETRDGRRVALLARRHWRGGPAGGTMAP
jgi:predicted GNAT superfamily acetyltransferase